MRKVYYYDKFCLEEMRTTLTFFLLKNLNTYFERRYYDLPLSFEAMKTMGEP